MTKRSDLEKQLAAGRQELEQLEKEAADLAGQIKAIKTAVQVDLSGVPVGKLAAAAEKQARQDFKLNGLEIAAQEIARRMDEKASQLAAVKKQLTLIQRVDSQRELNALAEQAIESLVGLIKQIEKLDEYQGAYEDRFSATPYIIFGRGYAEKLRHRVEYATKELADIRDRLANESY